MAESAEQPSTTLAPQEIKADASLLAVDLDDESYVMGVFTSFAPCTQSLCEVEAYLLLGVQCIQLRGTCQLVHLSSSKSQRIGACFEMAEPSCYLHITQRFA